MFKVMKEHWSKEDALTLKRMGKRKWARLNEEGMIVEFTTIDPTGRFHPDLKWIEVDHDTQWGTRITLFGSEISYEPTVGQPIDLHELFYKEQKEYEEKMNKLESKSDDEPEINQFTANIVPIKD